MKSLLPPTRKTVETQSGRSHAGTRMVGAIEFSE